MRERLRTGEWDAWLCSLRACLPRAPPGLLERRLLQFLEWGSEAARDLRQPEFLRVLAVALSSFSPEVWESLLHDSTSPKLLMQRIREEVLARGLGPVGRVDIPREVWDSCVPDGFAELVGRQFSAWEPLGLRPAPGGGGGGGYAAVWHERDPRGGGTLTRCATGDVRVLPRVCVFACGFSKILAQPCLSFGFARRVVCVCACVCAVSLCTCRAFLLVASSPPVPPNDAICDFYCPYRAFVTAHEEAAH